jgi:hypothetical protein
MLSESLVKVKKTIKAKVLELRRARRGFLNGNARTFNAAFTGTNLSHYTRLHANRLKGFLKGETQAKRRIPNDPRRDVYS